jgi:gentisate 1,2-dioxygenase
MSTPPVRWRIDGYQEWLAKEDVPVASGLAVDLMTLETSLWPRVGVPASFVHLTARGNYCDLQLLKIPAGGRTEPQRHLYEDVVYVLSGKGSTVLEDGEGNTRSFEWGRGSLFAIPLNMRYYHLNASGLQEARLAHVTNLPMVMKLYRDDDFVFNTSRDFPERLGKQTYFGGEGTFFPIREHRHIWETNFVPDLLTFNELRDAPSRGRNSTNIHFVLADGTMHAHVSEIPVGDYKKAHRHAAGYHIFQLSGSGYSTYWYEGQEPTRVDWTYGLVHSPDDKMWHQHFNTSPVPARYMAATLGSIRYPFLNEKMASWGAPGRNDDQIEYEDEDPSVRATFDREVAEHAAQHSPSAS